MVLSKKLSLFVLFVAILPISWQIQGRFEENKKKCALFSYQHPWITASSFLGLKLIFTKNINLTYLKNHLFRISAVFNFGAFAAKNSGHVYLSRQYGSENSLPISKDSLSKKII